jgi:hypothetical protein
MNDGANCTPIGAGTTMIVRRSWIVGNGNDGVAVSTCQLVLDGNYIESNTVGGVQLSNPGYYSITNNLIDQNGTVGNSGFGVMITVGGPSQSVFAFNTVASNHSNGASAAGIVCNEPSPIEDSIVAQNTTASGSQLTSYCMLSHVVTGADTATGATTSPAPVFVSATNFHLDTSRAQNAQCCIDKLPKPTTPYSDHDVDFTTRPKGTSATAYDIGAQEAQ